MNQLSQFQKLSRFVIDAFYLLERLVRTILISWEQVWLDLESLLKWLLKILTNRRLWLLIGSILVLLLSSNAKSTPDAPFVFWAWTTTEVEVSPEILITIEHPKFTATGATDTLELWIQNRGDKVIQSIKLVFWAENSFLRFKEGNEITIVDLNPSETGFATLGFETSRNATNHKIQTHMEVWYQFAEETAIQTQSINTQYLPTVTLNKWQQYWVSFVSAFARMPILLDGIVKGVGILGVAIVGILTLREKLGELMKIILPNFSEITANKL